MRLAQLAVLVALLPGCGLRGVPTVGPGRAGGPHRDPAATRRTAESAARALAAGLPPPPADLNFAAPATPGVVVFDPQAEPARQALAIGCGRWLELAVAGRLACGQSPEAPSLAELRSEPGRADLALAGEDARAAALRLGATHFVTGRLEGEDAALTLTVDLTDAAGKTVQKADARGTREQLAAQLPALARRLLGALHVAEAPPPAPAAAVLEDAGTVWWGGQTPDAGLTARLDAAARAGVFGALARLADAAFTEANAPLLQALAAVGSQEPVALTAIGFRDPALLPGSLLALRKRYPGNFALAHAEVWWRRNQGDYAGEAPAALATVRAAPRSPAAWLSFGQTVADIANRRRYGRTVDQISGDEWSELGGLYARWLHRVAQAARLDPLNAKAWNRVAEAATFAGENDLAVKAIWLSLDLDPRRTDSYGWALQMFQDKWLAMPGDLRRVAERAVAQPWQGADGLEMIHLLKEAKQDPAPLARALLQSTAATQDPYLRGRFLEDAGEKDDARQAFRAAVKANPGDGEAWHALGMNLTDAGRHQEALEPLARAVALLPRSADFRCDYGWNLKVERRFEEAAKQFRAALEVEPAHGSAHFGVAEVLAMTGRARAAIPEYEAALADRPWLYDARANLAWCLLVAGRYREAADEAEKVLAEKPENAAVMDTLACSLARLGDKKRSVQAHRKAAELAPESLAIRVNLAETLLRAGLRQQALPELDLAETSSDPRIRAEAARLRKRYLR